MKKVLIATGLVIALFGSLTVFSYYQGLKEGSKEMVTLMNLPKATVTNYEMTEDSAKEFPGTIVLYMSDQRADIVLFESLPMTQQAMAHVVFPGGIPHLNVTFVRSGERIIGLMPESGIAGASTSSFLQRANFNVMSKNGIASVATKNLRDQRAILLDFLGDISPDKLEGVSCNLKTLNLSKGDSGIKSICYKGILHHVSSSLVAKLLENAQGNVPFSKSDSYVIRVDDFPKEMLQGTKGGSVTITFNSTERFFGIAVGYFQASTKEEKNGKVQEGTFIILRPVTEKDIQV